MKPTAECSEQSCSRPAWARGLCSSHYSVWHRRTYGRLVFDRTCEVCGRPFKATAPEARYCTTGAGSCEARAKTGIDLRTGLPARPKRTALDDSPLFSPHREPTKREISSYRKVLRRDPCAYCGAYGGSLDHITPKGARNRARFARPAVIERPEWAQLTGACQRCNATKQDLSLLEALLWLPISRAYADMRPLLFR